MKGGCVIDHFIGVDLGSHIDYSAVAILTRSLAIGESGLPIRDSLGRHLHDWRLRAIERFPLRTAYSVVAKHIARIALMPELGNPRIILDSTGVGIGVIEMLRTELNPYPAIELWGVSITAGETWKVVRRYELTCSKVQLIGSFAAALHAGRFKVCRDEHGRPIPGADLLEKELAAFKVRQSTRSNAEIFGADGGSHDDCVLCCSVAVWAGSLPFMQMREIGEPEDRSWRPRESSALATEEDGIRAAESAALAKEQDRSRRGVKSLDDDSLWEGHP